MVNYTPSESLYSTLENHYSDYTRQAVVLYPSAKLGTVIT